MPKMGRPSGPSPAISKELDRIADMLVKRQAKSANAAMVHIIALRPPKEKPLDPDHARQSLHRWWRKQKGDRMAEARNRHQENSPSLSMSRSRTQHTSHTLAQLAGIGQATAAMMPKTTALEAISKSVDAMRLQGVFDQMTVAQKAMDNFRIPEGTFGAMKALEKQYGEASVFGQLQAAQAEMDRINMMINPLDFKG